MSIQSQIIGTARDLTAGAIGAGAAVGAAADQASLHMGANPMDSLEKLTVTVGGAVISTLFVRLVSFLFGLMKKK